jgi:TolB-like protein/Flp pilus assembly protein TadD
MSDSSKAVFLSYASQDAEAARRICEALRAAGVEVWFDQSELRGGDSWDAKIRKQIKECALFVPIISANTQARAEGYFRLEWKLAVDRSHLMADDAHFLFPVVIDETRDATARVPDKFRDVQWVRLNVKDTPETFAARVGKLLNGGLEAGRPRPAERGSAFAKASADKEGAASPKNDKPAWFKYTMAIGGMLIGLAYAFRGTWQPPRHDEPKAPVTSSSVQAEVDSLRSRIHADQWTRADFEATTPTIDRLIQAEPDNGDAWALRSIINSLEVTRNLDSGTQPLEIGKTAAERAQRLAPNSPLAELALGFHLTAMISRGGDVQAARPHIERGVRGLPAETLTRYAELTSPWLGYQFDDVERSAHAWLAADPHASFPAWILAQEHMVRRQAAEAVPWAEQAATDGDVTGARSLVTLFEIRYYLQADLAAGRAALDRIPTGMRSNHRVAFSRWLLAMAEHRWDQALQELAHVPDTMLSDRVYHGPKALLAGLSQQAAGRPEAAHAQFQESERLLRPELARDPDNQELHAVLALTLACLGRPADARGELAAVEPLMSGREPSVYTGQVIALIAQTHGLLGEGQPMATWLRRLFTAPSSHPFTPASLRLDPRFQGFGADASLQALLTEFAGLDPSPVAAAVKVAEKSVAVLAFANLSDDKNNEYFSDGITEELLNVLAKIPDLKVSARTSAFYFKGKEVPIPEIAKQLGVAYVVEGSVRKSGDKVRITAQLIKAADGFHVWSDTFTRDLKDIFAVQDEIAGVIARNLQLKIDAQGGSLRGAINTAAYEEYLIGRALVNSGTTTGMTEAIGHFRLAVKAEPGLTAAWVQIAQSYMYLSRWGGLLGEAEWAEAHQAIERAVALEPDSPDVLLALGWMRRTADWNWRGAEQALRAALRLRPDHADTLAALGVLLANIGQEPEATALARRAAELDPLNAATQMDLLGIFYSYGRFADAERAGRRALELAPGSQVVRSWLAMSLIGQGRLADAAAEAQLEPEPFSREAARIMVAIKGGQADAARAALHEFEKKADAANGAANSYAYLGFLWGWFGDDEQGLAWITKARAIRDPSIAWSRTPFYARLSHHPRWPEFLRSIGLADEQLK